LTLRILSSQTNQIASMPLPASGSGWQEVPFSFASPVRDTQGTIEIAASGRGAVLLDFVSMIFGRAVLVEVLDHDPRQLFRMTVRFDGCDDRQPVAHIGKHAWARQF